MSAGTLLLTGVGPAKLSDEAIGLTKKLASEGQVAELLAGGGKAIAGAGSKVALRDAPRLAAEYGGSVGDGPRSGASVIRQRTGRDRGSCLS